MPRLESQETCYIDEEHFMKYRVVIKYIQLTAVLFTNLHQQTNNSFLNTEFKINLSS